jgi:hypothetical protein
MIEPWFIQGPTRKDMLTFITEIHDGESDILAGIEQYDLEIRTLEGVVIEKLAAPNSGWTHDNLEATAPAYKKRIDDGADAYLGPIWVGSTEV